MNDVFIHISAIERVELGARSRRGRMTAADGTTVSVPILDDAVDEGTEPFLLRLSSPQNAYLKAGSGEAHGLITNDDHLQAMWLARIGRAMGRHITDAVGDRLAEDLSPGAHATVAGQSLDLTKADDAQALANVMAGLAQRFGEPGGPAANDDPFAPQGTGRAWNDPTAAAPQSMTSRELLLGSAFHLATDGGGSAPDLAAWGCVAHGRFDGEHADDTGRTSVDGEVLTGTLGADADWGRMLAGVAVSPSEGDGKFASPGVDTGDSGGIESTMTTVSPYLRFKLTERVSAWGLVGWGTGDMNIRFDDGAMAPIRTDIGMRMGALGARGALLEQDEWGGMDLVLKTDAFFVRMDSEKAANSAEATADASQVRLVLEGARAFAVSETATFRPSLELGLRHDAATPRPGQDWSSAAAPPGPTRPRASASRRRRASSPRTRTRATRSVAQAPPRGSTPGSGDGASRSRSRPRSAPRRAPPSAFGAPSARASSHQADDSRRRGGLRRKPATGCRSSAAGSRARRTRGSGSPTAARATGASAGGSLRRCRATPPSRSTSTPRGARPRTTRTPRTA